MEAIVFNSHREIFTAEAAPAISHGQGHGHGLAQYLERKVNLLLPGYPQYIYVMAWGCLRVLEIQIIFMILDLLESPGE